MAQTFAVTLVVITAIIILAFIILYLFTLTDVDYIPAEAITHEQTETYDFIICGAGTAGSIIAHNLGNAGHSVLVLERGLNQQADPVVRDGAKVTVPAESNKYAQTYLQEPYAINVQPFFKRLSVPMGKMIGGSSGVNYTVYVRPSRIFHDELAKIAKDESYEYNKYYEYYKDVERFIGETQAPEQRGRDGIIGITQISGAGTEFGDWVKELGDVTGSKYNIDYNTGTDLVGSPYLQSSTVFLQSGQVLRQWSSQYLNPAPKSVKVLTSVDCLRVLFDTPSDDEQLKATGVEVVQGDERRIKRYHCRHEVILCSGIESSLILERSGIGNSDILSAYNIKTLIDNKNVGENFRNHGGCYVFLLMGTTVAPQAFAPLFAHVPDNGFSKPGQRNIEILFFTSDYGQPVDEPTAVPLVIWNVNSKVQGSMHITGPGIQQPIITYNNYEDLIPVAYYIINILVPNLRLTGAPELQIGPVLNIPGELLQQGQEEHLAQWIYANQISGAHYTGQCSIGTVVDNNLRVIGTQNLRVADNSVFPLSVPGNTSCSAQGLGFFASYKILRNYE